MRDQARRDRQRSSRSHKSARTPRRYDYARARHASIASDDDRVEMLAMVCTQTVNRVAMQLHLF